ncbi:MAG: non-ribosomal peptide synthetase [Acidobacteria bacterium]|nr:MAG: non-ribosomal peptide synthetase [Acidobacteriota bacterium]
MKEYSERTIALSLQQRALLALKLRQMRQQIPKKGAIPHLGGPGLYPLSLEQEQLWFLNQLEPHSSVHQLNYNLMLEGQLNVKALEQALDEIVRRHEILRTSFISTGGQPSQIVDPLRTGTLSVVDLQAMIEPEREAQAMQMARELARKTFNLAEDRLLRATLLRLSDEKHFLLLTLHHIITDWWSFRVLFRELSLLYRAFSEGQPSPLVELPIQFGDFASWQRGSLSKNLERLLAYWTKQLAGAPQFLALPTDHQRPATRSLRGGRHHFLLPRSIYESLKVLSRQEHVTLFTTLLAVYQTLLFRYARQEDILVGTSSALRQQGETEPLIGFLLNTIVLRANFSNNPSFRELLGRMRTVVADAHAHQELPFNKLVEILQPTRDLSYTPLFQAGFIFLASQTPTLEDQGSAEPILDLPGLSVQGVDIDNETCEFDLSLVLEDKPEGLAGFFTYSTDLFEAATVQRMEGHLTTLVEGILEEPEQPVSELPLLTEGEREQLVTWNETQREYAGEQCVHELFAAQTARTPEAVAVVCGEQQLTYRQLNQRANQLAHYLQQQGVGPDILVGVMLERSLEIVVALLAILKAGGAYVPLDSQYPKERLAFMIEDAQLRLLLTQAELDSALPTTNVEVVYLDRDWERIAEQSAEHPHSRVMVDNLAYVIYTSGSTGQPNGVQVSHGGLLNFVSWHLEAFAVSASDRASHLAGISFDGSVCELWPYLSTGASLHLPKDDVRTTPTELRDWLLREAITISFLPTPLAERVLALEWPAQAALRIMLTGGDQLHQYPADSHRFVLVNLYGPTENTVVTTAGTVLSGSGNGPAPSIGRPIANTKIYILDPCLQPVSVGSVGELYVSGPGLARGYLQRAELTAERFVPHPFSNEPGARLYRTGDLVKRRAGGELEFIQRVDEQVKIRGYRIELGEIEAVLGQHAQVREAVVLARADESGAKRLIAYLTEPPEVASELSLSELRQYLKERLPEYMIPAAYVRLAAWPLTANGKIDRRALPAPELSREALEQIYVAPGTPVEELLATIWSEVLRVPQVGTHDNFFELGGHSLLATQVIARVREAFQVEVTVFRLFEQPTVKGLSKQIEIAQRSAQGGQLPAVKKVSGKGSIPLSYAQQRLWFLDQLDPGIAAYNSQMALRMSGHLDGAALEQGLSEIVRRHEALRTAFKIFRSQPVQVIAEPQPFTIPLQDLLGVPEIEREGEVHRLIKEEAQKPFDLAQAPLFRVRLLRVGEHEHILLLTIHHAIIDGWSVGVMIREITALYTAFATGKPSPLRELSIQYSDFAIWQREWLEGGVMDQQLAYWKRQLAGRLPVLRLPTARPRPLVPNSQGVRLHFNIPAQIAEGLKTLSRGSGVTLFMTLLAAFQTLLSRWSGQMDIIVGTPIAGRTHLGLEDLIGLFVNMLVIRTDLSGNPPFKQLLRRVREVTLEAYAHQDLPFEKLVEKLQPQRGQRTPLFQVAFALENIPGGELELPNLGMSPVKTEIVGASFDLLFSMTEEASALTGFVEYDTELLDAHTIMPMIAHFEALLEGIVADADQRLLSLPGPDLSLN